MSIQWNNEDYLAHYGVPRRSGRYKWGSGEDPYHHGASAPRGDRRKIKKAAKAEYKQSLRAKASGDKKLNKELKSRIRQNNINYKVEKRNIETAYDKREINRREKKKMERELRKDRFWKNSDAERDYAIARYENIERIRKDRLKYIGAIKPPSSRKYRRALKVSMGNVAYFKRGTRNYGVAKYKDPRYKDVMYEISMA